MTMRRAAAALTFVVAAVAGPSLVLSSPASAATCSTAKGVSVVVDRGDLGGGIGTVCDAEGGGKSADKVFPESHFELTPVNSEPGFVCRVNGAPSSDPCQTTPPQDAYWALFWADGKGGGWVYASTGVGGLKVPEGGYVALAWQSTSSRRYPGVAPAAHPAASPSPTPTPTRTPKPSPSTSAQPTHLPAPTAATDQPSQAPQPVAVPTATAEAPSPSRSAGSGKRAHGTAVPHPKAVSSTAAPTSAAGTEVAAPLPTGAPPAQPGGDGATGPWLAGGLVGVLLTAAGLVARRRSARG